MHPLPPDLMQPPMALTARQGGEPTPAGPDRLLAEAAEIARTADARLSAALEDLFVADHVRATDVQRAAMRTMLDGLVQEIEGELRAAVAERLGSEAPDVLELGRVPIVQPIFERAGVLRDRELVGLLLTRAEEHRIGAALRRVAENIPEWPMPSVSDAALDLALQRAESRRANGMGEPRLTAGDLPVELLHRLLWWAAAALRDYLSRTTALDVDVRDDALAGAVLSRLTLHDEGQTLEAAAMRVALTAEPNPTALVDALRGGRVSLFAALIAVRARIDYQAAFLLAADPNVAALAVLLRAIEAPLEVAAPVLLDMAAVNRLSDQALEMLIDDFADLSGEAAREALQPWRLDRSFRHAIAEIGRERRRR